MKILGVRYGHDSGASLLVDGEIVADISEERLTRIKNDASFPIKAIEKVLSIGGISSEEIDCLAIPGKEIHPDFFTFFDMPLSARTPISLKDRVRRIVLKRLGVKTGPVLPLYRKPLKLSGKCRIHLCEHHRAHAASAYYTSGLGDEKTLVVTMDGRGDNVSVAIWRGERKKLTLLRSFGGEGSLGWFYSNATEAMKWRHGSGEWKVMGLAPYGKPSPGALKGFHPEYSGGELVRPHNHPDFGRWNDHGANHYHGRDSQALEKLVDKMGRENFASEVQRIVEEQAFNLILPWLDKENVDSICCAGGFFLNVKFNQKLWYTGKLNKHWVYPDCGDSGIAAGAALDSYFFLNPDARISNLDQIYWGPSFTNEEIRKILDERGLNYKYIENPAVVAAEYLYKNCVIGWFQGRMESGPRALGHRSILMSPLRAENKDLINSKVKYREKFRPFCPSMLYEDRLDYLINPRDEFFMVTSFDVRPEKYDKIPAVVHEDKTARPQMVKKEIEPLYHELITEFKKLSGEGVILNTSFNIMNEPIVCHPREAIKCFYDTGIDALFLGNFLLEKPSLKPDSNE